MTTTTLLNESIANASTQVTTTLMAHETQRPLTELINAILNIKFQQTWVLLAIPIALVILFAYVRRGGLKRRNLKFFVVRAILITLIIAALASPQLHESRTEVKETPTVKILLDESPSMSVYGNKTGAIAEKLRIELISSMKNATEASEKISIDVLSAGDKTPLGDELYKIMTTTEENSIIVVLSDGNSNYGKNPVDVARQLGKSNTTIYAVSMTPEEKDIYIADIYGESKVTTPSNYQAEIRVETTAKEPVRYKISVYTDGVKITDMQVTQNTSTRLIPIKFSFNGIGVHQIMAEITADENDNIKINDKLFKTVEVVAKPKILLVTNKTNSPLKTVLDKLYTTELSNKITTTSKDYNAIYLDDVNANSISASTVEKLREYVLNGNGLVVVGGRNSFDYGNYNNSYFETLLPVMSMEKPVERRKQIAVVILMDISGSTEYGVSEEYMMTPKIDFEKALAIKILRSLDMNDSVGVIAFNTVPYTIAPLEKLGERRVDMEENIMRLRFGGGTEMLTSLDMVGNILRYYAVNKYVIVLSDGVIRTSRMSQTIEKARQLGSEGIKVYTVGVGFDTDEAFMQSMAEAGKGLYFKPEAYQRLNIEFGRGLEEETLGMYQIDVRDEYHFITRNTNISAQISGYNRVYEKSISQLLLATKSGNPVLTVWNFGLGRVATLTTDDGLGWAGSLYQEENNKIISSMTNWAIGDLEKNKKVIIKTEDIHLGEMALIEVDADSRPNTKITREDDKSFEYAIELKTVGLNTYLTSIKPNESGIYLITATSKEGADTSGMAVNYPIEYAKLTPDLDELSTIARAANGKLYYTTELQELEGEILEQMKKLSTKTITEEKPLYPYIIALIILIYFADTAIRRIQDIRRLRG